MVRWAEEPAIDPTKEDDYTEPCNTWFEPDILLDDPDKQWSPYELKRSFTIECTLQDGHPGPHVFDVLFHEWRTASR